MTGNVSKDDRIIRVVIGLWFISMVFVGPETNWGWFGIVPLLSAVAGFCPLYTKLGFDTKEAAGENIDVAEVVKEEVIKESSNGSLNDALNEKVGAA